MKTNIGLAIGTAIAALGIAITAVPEAKAGGVYWNNNGGGGVVVNRGYTYGPRGYYNYGPRGYYNYGPSYYGGRGLLLVPTVPVAVPITDAQDASGTELLIEHSIQCT